MEKRKENKMGVMPVPRLLVTMSLPIMASMLVQALYNVVDSIFVAQISENALTAVSLALPIQTLMIAVSVGTGVGINALLSRRLGEKQQEEANTVAAQGLLLSVASWLVFLLFGIFFSRMFIAAFTNIPEIIEMGTEYVSICTIFSFGVFVQVAFERIMQSTGNTIYHMFIQGVGAVTNIILDPIMIFGYFGCPAMGVAGAAWATVIGQIVAMILGAVLNHFKNKEVRITLAHFKPHGRIIKEIYSVGFPSIIMQSISSIMTVGLNFILSLPTAISVYGVYYKLQTFVFMPIFGLTNAMVPIIGYNFGAKNRERIMGTIKLGLVISVGIMAAGTILFQLIPDKLLLLFNAKKDMLSLGVPALRIIATCFVFAGIAIIFSAVYQALGHGFLSMALSIIRQLLVILPAAYILKSVFGGPAVWFAFPLSEIVATTISIFLYRYIYKTVIQPLGNSKEASIL